MRCLYSAACVRWPGARRARRGGFAREDFFLGQGLRAVMSSVLTHARRARHTDTFLLSLFYKACSSFTQNHHAVLSAGSAICDTGDFHPLALEQGRRAKQ